MVKKNIFLVVMFLSLPMAHQIQAMEQTPCSRVPILDTIQDQWRGMIKLNDEFCADVILNRYLDAASFRVHWVLCKDGKSMGFLIGTLNMLLMDGGILVVRLDDAFQNKGYGTKILQSFCDFMRSYGMRRVFLEVAAENVRAIHVYEKLNFTFEGEENFLGLRSMKKVF